jgi:AraC-like DNA-binding protein
MSTPSLINRYAQVMIHSAAARGYDSAALCRDAGMHVPAPLNQSQVFSAENLARISRQVKVTMEDEFCGLTPSRCRLGAFELMCELAVSSSTLGEALDRAFRLYALLSDDVRFTLTRERGVATIQVEREHPEFDTENFLPEWWLLIWRGIPSWLIGARIPPLAVEFPHEQAAPAQEYALAFAPECRFRQKQARLLFDPRHLDRPVVRTFEDLKQFLMPSSLDLVSMPGIASSLKARIKNQLKQHFYATQNFPSMEDIAQHHHMCSQTLRRRLEEENSSYRQVKEEIRREIVMKWLSNVTIPIGEVSRMGGFAEANGLTRAVKAWVGMSPTEYRARIAGRRH